ncbi:uncharacterized protein LOC113869049 [Abrus precatorius]|uniref:Uncharacterized protein LOC113869049 n=1 Tax=Abrus precatorius TaxID=3816 RepID=A0A8B8LXI3_ABRPR|nr:uncharacterized protein LOC113869049 [Abrus precatorius]
MVPTASNQKALALKQLPRNRTWDSEYDIDSHLQKKNREIVIKDPKGEPEMVQFMDGLYSIVESQVLHVEDQNTKNIAEETTTEDDDVIIDLEYKYFFGHLKPHGKSYVLDIPEDSVFVKYESESSTPESTSICATYTANYVSNEEVNVCLDTDMQQGTKAKRSAVKSTNVISNHVASYSQKHRGMNPKGAKLSAAKNGNIKSSDVTSKVQKHAGNCIFKRRSKRLKEHAMKTDNPSAIAARVIVEIEDSDDEVPDKRRSMQGHIVKVEHCWEEYDEANGRILFKEKLMEELKVPYCEDEHKRLLHEITVRKPVQHHRDLRGRIKIYEEDYSGFSFLDHYVDLAETINSAHDDHPRVLNLLRGFFYWLKNLSHEGSFMPWKDPSCLDVLPQ